MNEPREIERIASREVYRNRWMTVREDEVRRADGSTGVFGVVDKPTFVVVVPIDDDGFVHMVEQYRYPIGRRSLELPQGSWEGDGGLSDEQLAAAELGEETGLTAGRLERLGTLHVAPGYSSQDYVVFHASALVAGPRRLEVEESGMATRLVALTDVGGLIRSGAITDATSIAALSLWSIAGT